MRSKKIWNSKVLSIGIRTILFISLIFWAINSILVYLVDPHLSLLSIANVFLVVYPAMLLVASLCYCIVCYKKIYTTFLTAENKLICIIPTIYFAVSTVLIFNPINSNRNEIVQFSRVLGNGMMWNVDVSRRIVNFYLWFALFAIILGLFFLLTNYIRQIHNHPEALKMNHFIDHFSILAFCSLVLRCITYFQTDSVTDPAFNFAHSAIMLVMIISFLYNCAGLYKKINISNYLKLHFMVFSASIPIAVILHMNSSHGRVLFGIWSFLAILINFILFLSKEKFAENKISNTLSHGSIALSVFPLMTSVYIESIHILNQHKIFISHPARIYYVIVFVFMVFSLVYCIKSKRVIHNWKKISYPIIIIGIACISVQIPLSSTYNPDLFEGANAGILISDFLHFGSIPNIEHYGGHMMTSVWEAIIYAILNSDIYGAFVSPYSNMLLPILVLLFYYFVKEIWNEDAALYTVLFFPFYNYWSYFGLGMLVCLAVVAYVKKSTYMRAIALWGAFVWCALYRLDLGFAYGFAAIVTLVTYLIYKRQKGTLKKLILSLTGWCIVGGIVWCLVCLIKQINPINRLIEFLQLNLSNQNWAYTGIGNEGNTVFAWSYLILPFLVAGCLLYSTISKSFREQTGENKWLLLLMLGWSYYGNFTRGLVRHSLAENATIIVTWTAYLFIALFICCIVKKPKVFIPAFMVLMLLNTQFVQSANFSNTSIAENFVNKPEEIIESWKQKLLIQDENGEHYETYWEQIKREEKKVDRVKLSTELINYSEKYRYVLDALLEPGDPFVDYMNKTLLFCILERKNPVYVSQSPLQLSGEFTQRSFIQEISTVPVVLMPLNDYRAGIRLDGLTNVYRYYLVSEYIYENYQPLCRYGNDYAIWVKKGTVDYYWDRLNKALQKTMEYNPQVSKLMALGMKDISLTPYKDGSIKLMSIGKNPMITDLQKLLNLSEFYNHETRVLIKYSTDEIGQMKVFYTTDNNEDYSTEKVKTVDISGDGEAEFIIPITQYTRLRLDIPEKSTVIVSSIKTCPVIRSINYGYDLPIGDHHSHTLGHLPRVWAENDERKAINNTVQEKLLEQMGFYLFDSRTIKKTSGNYLHIKASYNGNHEYTTATIVFGEKHDNAFSEKYLYSFTIKEGCHDYLIRCSTDYFWYCNETNAVKLLCDEKLSNVEMKILNGD